MTRASLASGTALVLIVFVVFLYNLKDLNSKEMTQNRNLVASMEKEDGNTGSDKPLPPLPEIRANGPLKPAGQASAAEELERIWNYVYQMQYKCTDSLYLGGMKNVLMDGAYDVCIEPQFWTRAKEPGYKCLMYSFGVGNDFSFDDEMARLGCEVHSFDPSMKFRDGMVRKSGVVFHKIGISAQDLESDSNGWKMRTLSTLIKELGHSGRYLDYLKVDTDAPQGGFEDTVIHELLTTGLHSCVRQYAMEIHVMGPLTDPTRLDRCRTLYRQMTLLNDQGWRLYNTTDNARWNQLHVRPDFTQWDNRMGIMTSTSPILWETAFVNFNVKGPCVV